MRRITAGLAVLALSIAGCGSDGDQATPSGGDPTPTASPTATTSTPPGTTLTPTPTTTPTTPSASPTPTPTPKPKPKPAVRPTAHDGTNFEACRDGRCHVLVTRPMTIRVTGPGGRGKFVVKKIVGGKLHFDFSSPGGGGNGTLGGPCAFTFGYGGGSSRCGEKPTSSTTDPAGLTVRVPYVSGHTAILHLSMR